MTINNKWLLQLCHVKKALVHVSNVLRLVDCCIYMYMCLHEQSIYAQVHQPK